MTGGSLDRPHVSVIIPNYNHESYLAQRIDSVLRQTYENIEVIILDDASSDGSMAVIERYAGEARVRILANKNNSGSAFCQWNRGVREARGEYVWVAESDDYADPQFLETLVARLDVNPRAGLAYCDSCRVSRNGQMLGIQSDHYRAKDSTTWQNDYENDGVMEIQDHLVFWNTIPNASAVLFRRQVFQQVGGAPEDMRLCGDWLTWIKMLLVSDVVYVAKPMNYYRWHGESVRATSGNILLLQEHYQVLRYVVDHLHLGRRHVSRACNHIAAAWVCSLLERPCSQAWRHFGDVYRKALLVDRFPWVRLVKQLLLYLPRKLSHRAKVRKIGIFN